MPISLGTTTITALFLGTTSITSAYLGSTQVFGGASAFTPLDLFSTGSQGIWLDPSDLTTMFSDRAGTTPVTTPGTVVGLRLDKSKGLALGSELFLGLVSGSWTAQAGTTITSDLSYSTSGTSGPIKTGLLTVGKTYLVSYNISATNSAAVRFQNQDVAGSGTIIVQTATGGSSGTFYISATAGGLYLRSSIAGTSAITINSLSVREIAGNHATAPTDAARPIYGVEPKGGRRNLLLATDTLATQSLTVTAVAHALAFTGTGTVTLSGASTAGPLVGTGAGNRVSLTFTPTAASLTLTVSGSVTLGQLELGSSATAYQKVVTAEDVTEAGVPTCHYCRYDGSNSSMSTAAIDFTATDKMSVFAGVRKLSDGTRYSIFAELGSGIANSITVHSPFVGATFDFTSRGTSVASATSTAVYPAPISVVLTGLGDISGDLATLRINGAQAAQSTANQGTGTFGNAPLFFGRRQNAGTINFNGRDYGIIIVGKAASAGEITDTETWLAARTAQVTL